MAEEFPSSPHYLYTTIIIQDDNIATLRKKLSGSITEKRSAR